MICSHLKALETELLTSGLRETYRGTPWSQNCREWVYFDVVLDTASLAARMQFDPCVQISENLDPKSGTERGFYCTQCKDAVMGQLAGTRLFG